MRQWSRGLVSWLSLTHSPLCPHEMACQCLTVITLRQSNRGQYFLSFSYLASPIAWKSTSTKDQVSQYILRIQTDDLVLSFRMFSNNYNEMRKRSNQTNGFVKANIEKNPSILRTLQWKWTDSKELKEIDIMVRNRAIKILFKNSSVDDIYIQWYHNHTGLYNITFRFSLCK